MKIRWGNLGGQLAIGYILVGMFLVFLGWNGAASYDRVSAQIPYLVSGGIGGLALVVVGSGLMIAQSNRADRAALQATLDELRDAVDRVAASGVSTGSAPPATGPPTGPPPGPAAARTSWSAPEVGADEVVAGPSAYHREECKLIVGQSGLAVMTVAAAEGSGLTACRICLPS
jgi:hypothetical protein